LQNDRLAYNLGNAYLKHGDLGHAILWYERARRLAPRDPEILFNLNFARSQLKDEPVQRDHVLVDVFFFLKSFFSPRIIQQAALIANALFWLGLAVWSSKRHPMIRAWPAAALLGVILFTPTAAYLGYQDTWVVKGVILPEEQAVRSGFDDRSSTLFILHAGTMVRIEDSKNDFVRIEYTPEAIGWIPQDSVGMISAQ
jgi:tetratricopeptide (TPR) repeat protein